MESKTNSMKLLMNVKEMDVEVQRAAETFSSPVAYVKFSVRKDYNLRAVRLTVMQTGSPVPILDQYVPVPKKFARASPPIKVPDWKPLYIGPAAWATRHAYKEYGLRGAKLIGIDDGETAQEVLSVYDPATEFIVAWQYNRLPQSKRLLAEAFVRGFTIIRPREENMYEPTT